MHHLPSHNEAKGIWRLCLHIFMCALVLLAPLRCQQHEYCMRRITAEMQTPMVNYEWIKWEFILWLQLLRNSCWWMSNQLMIRASREEKQEATKRKKEWKNEQGQSESWWLWCVALISVQILLHATLSPTWLPPFTYCVIYLILVTFGLHNAATGKQLLVNLWNRMVCALGDRWECSPALSLAGQQCSGNLYRIRNRFDFTKRKSTTKASKVLNSTRPKVKSDTVGSKNEIWCDSRKPNLTKPGELHNYFTHIHLFHTFS